MADAARVEDVETLKAFDVFVSSFRESMINRCDEFKNELSRVTQWIHAQAPEYWRSQKNRAEQMYAEASMALTLCRAKVREEDHEACTDQKRQVELCKRRLELCSQRLREIKVLQLQWDQFLQESRQGFAGAIDLADDLLVVTGSDIKRTIEVLDRYRGTA